MREMHVCRLLIKKGKSVVKCACYCCGFFFIMCEVFFYPKEKEKHFNSIFLEALRGKRCAFLILFYYYFFSRSKCRTVQNYEKKGAAG